MTAKLSEAELRYLDAAVKYAAMSPVFRSPATALALAVGLTPQEISNRLTQARKAGFLTSAGVGRKGGHLTELGVELSQSEQYLGRTVTVSRKYATGSAIS